MRIFAISDMHLSIGETDKNMDIFGIKWKNYMDKIKSNWSEICREDDVVIVCGDTSWAMDLKNAKSDFEFLNGLPGTKLVLKGNHDYWWNTAVKMNEFVLESNFRDIYFLHNNSYSKEQYSICGTRGWILPEDRKFAVKDKKIYDREINRFMLSLNDAVSKGKEGSEIIAAFHFPPFSPDGNSDSEFIKILKEYNVKKCIFGHIHESNARLNQWKIMAEKLNISSGIEFKPVSADIADFKPQFIY